MSVRSGRGGGGGPCRFRHIGDITDMDAADSAALPEQLATVLLRSLVRLSSDRSWSRVCLCFGAMRNCLVLVTALSAARVISRCAVA